MIMDSVSEHQERGSQNIDMIPLDGETIGGAGGRLNWQQPD